MQKKGWDTNRRGSVASYSIPPKFALQHTISGVFDNPFGCRLPQYCRRKRLVIRLSFLILKPLKYRPLQQVLFPVVRRIQTQ